MSNDVWGTPVVADDLVYVTSFEVHALDVATGRRRFKTRDVAWSMAVADGRVHASDGPTLFALDAREGTDLWRLGTDGWVYSLRAEHGTVLTGTRGGGAQAWDAATGRVRWHFEAPAVFLCPPAFVPGPAVTGGGVYLADYLGTVYALDAADGRDRWRIATEARASIEPVLVAAGHVHVGSGKGLYTLDAVTGTPKWRFQAGGGGVGAPAGAEGRNHYGATDHQQYTLKADDGRLRWKLATGGEITGSPVVRDGVVYACSKDRCVYALDAEKGTGTARTA
jgi:outer membrane protein assembly factor BamB